MMSSGVGVPCGRLPVPLDVCPCCSAGIKPARGWTWFNSAPFVEAVPCRFPANSCGGCILNTPPKKAGLLWIGEKFYPKPSDWMAEADKLGVSRRVSMIPKDFQVGVTWIFAAHRKCIPLPVEPDADPKFKAGVFHVWRPDRIEYVTKGDETQEELEALVKRGIIPVKVKRADELNLE